MVWMCMRKRAERTEASKIDFHKMFMVSECEFTSIGWLRVSFSLPLVHRPIYFICPFRSHVCLPIYLPNIDGFCDVQMEPLRNGVIIGDVAMCGVFMFVFMPAPTVRCKCDTMQLTRPVHNTCHQIDQHNTHTHTHTRTRSMELELLFVNSIDAYDMSAAALHLGNFHHRTRAHIASPTHTH